MANNNNEFDRAGIHKKTKTKFDLEGYDYQGYHRNGYDRRGFNRKGIHRETGTIFDPDGFDNKGYDIDGFDRDGFNVKGFDREGFDRDGFDIKGYNREGFDRKGFDIEGIHKETGTLFDTKGYDKKGHDKDGYDRAGYKNWFDREGYSIYGYDRRGYDREGYNKAGYNKEGYDRRGFNREGIYKETGTEYDTDGYNVNGLDSEGYYRSGFNPEGIHKETGTRFDTDGFDNKGYDIDGYNRDGFNFKGFDREGFDREGFNIEGIHKETETEFNPKGYKKNGYDKDGYNEDGYNKDGYDREGYTAEGYDKLGISREGINRKTGEKDERIIFAEEFIASKSTIEQFAREKQMSVEEVNSRIAQIRHSICVKEGIDNLLTGNSNRYLGTLNTKKEQLLSGKITVRDVRGIDAILKLCDMEETERITGMLVRELTAHDISILDYQKILGIKELGSGLPSAIVEKLEYFNGMVKRSNNPQIRMAAREMHAEISRVREYRTPYRANEGEALGYFANPTDKEPTVVSITDEHREMAREYLHATDEFICNKTMTATLMKLVRGDLDAEKITRAKKEKELRGLQQEDKELDDTLSMAEKVIENRENNGNEQRS